MKYFGSTSFSELLACSISGDENFRNSAQAFNGLAEKLASGIPATLIFGRLAHESGFQRPVPMLAPLERLALLANGLKELPEEVLDLLAWQFHVEAYDKAVNAGARRQMIWNSIRLHRKAGTPWAVRYGLETTLQVPARISEWFEYGGEPYFFRVYLDVSQSPVTLKSHENAISVIMAHKNVRSWLEYLRTQTTRKLPVYPGSAANNRTVTCAFTWRWQQTFGDLKEFAGTGINEITRTAASLVNHRLGSVHTRFYPKTALAQLTRTKTGVLHVPN